MLLGRWMQKTELAFRFTTIQCNRGFASKIHVDSNNVGESRTVTVSEFTGGQLWLFDSVTTSCSLKEAKGCVPIKIKERIYGYPSLKPRDGALGTVHNIKNKLLAFNGRTIPRAVLSFLGKRYSLVFFVHNPWRSAETKVALESPKLEFNPPARNS